MISIVVAVAKNGVIGKSGGMPWYLPADLKNFKEITTGHPVIMGRVTHESIGHALPDRINIVVSSDKNYKVADGCELATTLADAINLVKRIPEIFIIGGEAIYKQALPIADKIYLTKVNAAIEGDKYFKFDPKQWNVIKKVSHKSDNKNPFDYEFQILTKKLKH